METFKIKFEAETRIKEVTEDGIFFENGLKLISYHAQDCCENVYADWEYIKEEIRTYEKFDEILIEKVENAGFRIQFKTRNIYDYYYFIPCFNEQNGYYSNELMLFLVKNDYVPKRWGGANGEEIEVIDITQCTLEQIG